MTDREKWDAAIARLEALQAKAKREKCYVKERFTKKGRVATYYTLDRKQAKKPRAGLNRFSSAISSLIEFRDEGLPYPTQNQVT